MAERRGSTFFFLTTLDTRRSDFMRSWIERMPHLAKKVSVMATVALVLSMLGTILPLAAAGLSMADDPAPEKVKAKPAPAKVGLLLNDSRAFQGYTLIAPMFSKTTYLIDMQGKVVRTWESDYTPGVSAYLLENGHLLRPGAQQPSPFGLRPGRRWPGSGIRRGWPAPLGLQARQRETLYRTTTSPGCPMATS